MSKDRVPGSGTDGPFSELSDEDLEALLYDTDMDAAARYEFIEALDDVITEGLDE